MLPVIEIGGRSVPTYALVYTLTVLIAGSLAWQRLGRLGAAAARWRTGLPLIVLALVLGLFLPAWGESQVRSWLTGRPPEPIYIRVYYALGCAVLAVLLYAHRYRLDLLAALDNLLPVFALVYSLGRLGCLAAGCGGGRPTDAALSLYLPDEHDVWAHRYPTQIISSGFQFLLFLWLARARPWPAWLNRRGARSAVYVLLFCVERFTLEFLRTDYRPLVGPFSLPHLWMLAGLAALVGAVALPFLTGGRRPVQP